MGSNVLQQREKHAHETWGQLDPEIKALVLFREWVVHELESLREGLDPEDLENHSCVRHYQVISGVMFAYGLYKAPEHIEKLPQQSIEILLHNYGIDPGEFI